MKKNILFVFPRFHTNKYHIIKKLIKENHDVNFIVANISKTEYHDIINPIILKENIISKFISILGLGKKNNRYYFVNIWTSIKFIYFNRPDYIIIRYYNKIFALQFFILALIFKSKILFYNQLTILDYKKIENNSFKYLLLLFLTKYLKCRFLSPLLHKVEESSLKLKKFLYYYPFSYPCEKKNNHKKENTLSILIIGKFIERKNHNFIIDLITNTKITKYVDLDITIIGEVTNREHLSNYNKLNDKINNLNLNNKIRIKKNIKYINILNLYKKNDILLSPSHNEPASVSIIEALSQGLPVISNDTSGTSLFIKNFYNGFRVNINNLNQTAEYIKYLSNNKNYNQMSNNAYEFSINNFSYSNSYYFFLKAIE